MLHYMTKTQARLFTRPEIIERLAAMLNYFLVRLAGPKYNELKVKDPAKYNFQPRWLLKKIATTYLNFVNFPDFPGAVAADGRSYDPEVFKEAAAVLLRTKLIDEVGLLFSLSSFSFPFSFSSFSFLLALTLLVLLPFPPH